VRALSARREPERPRAGGGVRARSAIPQAGRARCGLGGDRRALTDRVPLNEWIRWLTERSSSVYSPPQKEIQGAPKTHAPPARSQAGRHSAIPDPRDGYRFSRGPDRSLEPAYRVLDRALQGPQEGPPFASRAAQARGSAASSARLPQAFRRGSLPQGRERARASQVAISRPILALISEYELA